MVSIPFLSVFGTRCGAKAEALSGFTGIRRVGQEKSQSIHTATQIVRQRRITMAQDVGEVKCKARGAGISDVPVVVVKRYRNSIIIVVGKVLIRFGFVFRVVWIRILCFSSFSLLFELRVRFSSSRGFNECHVKANQSVSVREYPQKFCGT
jgi:hypothetical protein